MKIIKLYTGEDGKSHFKEIDSGIETQQPLGSYSKKFQTSNMSFREFSAGLEFPWHTAPQNQYIIYIEGEVEVEASDGEKRVFRPGDILLASDLTGAGHVTRTLSSGKSIIVEAGKIMPELDYQSTKKNLEDDSLPLFFKSKDGANEKNKGNKQVTGDTLTDLSTQKYKIPSKL